MSRRRHWHELPESVRTEIERHTGKVNSVATIPTGASCDVAVTLDTAAGRVFCKGGNADSPSAWLYRNEARVNPWLPEVAPRLLWTVERDGWLLLGFEHVAGRHPDLAPGSPDLPLLAALLSELSGQLTPCPPPAVRPFAGRWHSLIAPSLVDGDTLLHTDMTPRNFLVPEEGTGSAARIRLVDWSSPAHGAAWIDTAFLLLRLVRAGHTPSAAEAWAVQIPAYASAPEHAVTGFADALVQLWRRKQLTAPALHHGPLLDAAQRWAAHRGRPKRVVGLATSRDKAVKTIESSAVPR
ncbi:hypothetical protein [Micromonospora sp. WMMC250]|uniref:hypothetical protein n=1 Tax=Micromonospora sp. WMMC250 TaxID=3014781 RepID=UPI0022B67B34|nr:hypothetical protein [Micromonospora sp. WMMC250]MCZ7376682.1 hypothetical protein [Micromonospora sp. WMMC250]